MKTLRCRKCNICFEVEDDRNVAGLIHRTCGSRLYLEKYLYVVHMHGDSNEYHNWFSVWPTKEQAMAEAEGLAKQEPTQYPNGVKFVSRKEQFNHYDDSQWVVVEEALSVYHGA